MTKKEWDKKFDEKFVEFAADGSEWGAGLRIKHTGTTEDREILDNIKSFIRDLIQDDRKHQKSERLKRVPSPQEFMDFLLHLHEKSLRLRKPVTRKDEANEIRKLVKDKLKPK